MSNIIIWSRRALWAVCIASFAVTLWVRIDLVGRHVLDIGSAEDCMVHGFQRLLLGQPLYDDPERSPFAIMQYTPLHYYAVAFIARAFGDGAYDVQSLYVISRVFCLLCNLLSCFVLYRICRKLRAPSIVGFGAATLFFTYLHELYWSRPDSPFMLFFLLHVQAMLPLLLDPQRPFTWKLAIWPAITAALCLLAKQSGVDILLIDAVVLWTGGQRRALLMIVAQFALWCALLAAVVHMESGLHNAYKNVVLGNINGSNNWLFTIKCMAPFFLVGIGWAIAAIIAQRWLPRKTFPLLSRYLWLGVCITLAWAVATGFKRGSNINYFTPHFVFCWLLCALALAQANGGDRTMRAFRDVAGVMLALTVGFRALLFWYGLIHHDYVPNDPVLMEQGRVLAEKLKSLGLRSDDKVYFTYACNAEQFLPEQTVMQERTVYEVSGDALPLNHEEFYRMAERGEVRFVITVPRWRSVECQGRSLSHFVERFTFGPYVLHEFQRDVP